MYLIYLLRRILDAFFKKPEKLVAIQKPIEYTALNNTEDFDNALCRHLRIARYQWQPMKKEDVR